MIAARLTGVCMARGRWWFRRYVAALAGLAAAVIAFIYWKSTGPGAYMWDQLKLKLPVFGGLVHKVSLSRFSRSRAPNFTKCLPRAMEV